MTGELVASDDRPCDFLWRADAPPSRVIVASNGRVSALLGLAGQVATELVEHTDLSGYFEGLDAGVWVIEIGVKTVRYETDYGTEYGYDVEHLSQRFATDEEVYAIQSDEHPWDPRLWEKTGIEDD